jgi:hypothetical protein
MVHAGIKAAYDADLKEVAALPGVTVAARATAREPHADTEAQAWRTPRNGGRRSARRPPR